MSRRLDLIGIGPGNPDWLTLAAVDAIQHLDVLFVVLKEHDVDDLVEFRREVLRRHRPCLLYTSPSPRDRTRSRMPSSA